MKKIITFLITITVSVVIHAQSGRIRISFVGFDCYRETWDDILHMDGKGDEVFFNFGFTLADKNGGTKLSYEKRTPVYGDNTRPQFNNRINVGSFVDAFGNMRGGIKAGDNYRCNDIIGEYDMADGDILTIIPTGWEYDPIADNSASFFSTMRGFYSSLNQKIAPIMIVFHAVTGDLAGVIYHAGSLGISSIKAGGEQGELGKAGTRPIGMEKYGDFSPKLVALNTPNLNTICSSDMGFGRGVIAVNYDEVAVGNARDHGNYTILLKVEYFPNPVTTTAANNPPAGNKTPPAGGFKTISATPAAGSTTTTNVAGIWTGTYGTGQNNNPSYYSFRLNADGSMEVVDASGNAIAKGRYTFSNNLLSGTYAYTSNNMTFSFAATLSGAQFNGTWGSGNNTSGGGKWVMNKASMNMKGNIR